MTKKWSDSLYSSIGSIAKQRGKNLPSKGWQQMLQDFKTMSERFWSKAKWVIT